MRLRHLLLVLVTSWAGAACSSNSLKIQESDRLAPIHLTPWVVQGCSISARGADVRLSTTGTITESGTLHIRLAYAPWLAQPPVAEVTGLPVALAIEGTNRNYNLYLPYTPETGAQLLQESTYLTLAYQPLGSPDIREVSFPTAPLMLALGVLNRTCPHP